MKHNTTCTCDDCGNKQLLDGMKYIVFTEHRGYMEEPKEFNTYEKAVKYCKEKHSFTGGYVVRGNIVWKPESMGFSMKLFKESMKRIMEQNKGSEDE